MDQASFEQAMKGGAPAVEIGRLAERFEHAFRETKDLQSAMAAVNEVLAEPLTYQQFFAALGK